MEEWRAREPAVRFVLSTTTSTGHALAAKRLAPEDVLIYFPADFPPIVRRVLAAIQPRAMVLVEVELWPNLIRQLAARGVPVSLINGRLSDRSFRGYRRLGAFTRRLLPRLRAVCVQSEADRERFVALGAPADRVHVTGSAKFDIVTAEPARPEIVAAIERAGFGGRPLLLGGSTWAGEEAILLDLYRELKRDRPELGLILCPRHVERAAEVEAEMVQRGLVFARRTDSGAPPAVAPDVLFVNTTGELKDFYACVDVIFVGKSLTQRGGQNPIEPAALGKAILVGPHMENFTAVVTDFLAAGGLVQVADAAGLAREAARLLDDPAARQALGARAAEVVRRQSGALRRTFDILARNGVVR
jgi:3-deoxy-D-manno-octulosonic-acid transferase